MEDFDDEILPPGPDLTAELYTKWRSPRFGTANPERMDNPVWDWLIRSGVTAYQANKRFNGPDPGTAGSGWCFDRFGQSVTMLPDGRELLIAGEHEDHYDADFNIYNDVVLRHPDGLIEIFGYPRSVFPPTDFHTATLAGNRIILIGSGGYQEDRRPGVTPVQILDLKTLSINAVESSGTAPGWLHDHQATLSEDGRSILVERGKLQCDHDVSLIENLDDWCLHLEGWRWERLTERKWKRWGLSRNDRRTNHLWEYEQAVWRTKILKPEGLLAQTMTELETPTLEAKLGGPPDLELFSQLFQPQLDFDEMPKLDDEYGVERIRIDGVVIRYVRDSRSIQMTVEGELPRTILETLTRDLTKKFSKLENAECVLREL